MKNAKILQKISSDFYLINAENPLDFYWEIISKIVRENCSTGAIIAGEKSLEINIRNLAPTEKLVLYTEDFSARIQLFDGYELHFRTLATGEKTDRKNFFKILKKYSAKFGDFSNIFVPCVEISLLEALSLREQEIGKNDFLVINFLKKNHTKLNGQVFTEIVKFRYIRAVNRLRILARDSAYLLLYSATLDAIKTSGGGIFLNID